jgi:hypothetical protein
VRQSARILWIEGRANSNNQSHSNSAGGFAPPALDTSSSCCHSHPAGAVFLAQGPGPGRAGQRPAFGLEPQSLPLPKGEAAARKRRKALALIQITGRHRRPSRRDSTGISNLGDWPVARHFRASSRYR